MAIKNKRTSIVKENTVESRLKKQLKEDFDSFTEAEGDEDELDSTSDDLGGGEFDSEGGNDLDMEGGDEGIGDDGIEGGDMEGMGDPVDELDPTQEQWMDQEVDELLGGEDELGEDDITLDEANGDDDLDLIEPEESGDDFDSEGGDLDFEDDFESSDDEFDSGIEDDGAVSADELNDIIAAPDTYNQLGDNLANKAMDLSDDELQQDLGGDDFSDSDLDMIDDSEDDLFEESEDFGVEEEGEEMNEDAGDYADPMKGIRGEDKGDWDKGYEGVDVKDELMEALEAMPGFTEEDTELEGTYSKAPKGAAKAKKIDTKPTFSKVSDTVKGGAVQESVKIMKTESVKKSKMLVKAAEVILKLKESNERLKLETEKLKKVNGIFAAVGEKMSKETRKKIAESFEGCKTQTEVTSLYEKVVKVIKEKNKPSLNEAVNKSKSNQVKTFVKENKSNNKETVEISQEQMRKNHLMGISNSDEGYFNFK